MRLLWEESGFELVGAFCVAAFSLAAAWVVLESVFQLNGVVAGVFAAAAAAWVLEGISRRHYAGRQARSERRPSSSRTRPPSSAAGERHEDSKRRAA